MADTALTSRTERFRPLEAAWSSLTLHSLMQSIKAKPNPQLYIAYHSPAWHSFSLQRKMKGKG